MEMRPHPPLKGKRRPIPISSSTVRINPWNRINLAPNPSLPIKDAWEGLLDALSAHQVVMVVGETGSGKTTQIPKALATLGLGVRKKIVCTQPRRVAAIAVASRLQEELGPKGKDLVGYRIRFRSRVSKDTRIHFVTDGILLSELKTDPYLRRYDAVIVDEAHERTLNIDFLLGLIRRIIEKRHDLKLVITSATLDIASFKRAFPEAPILKIKGRQFPVDVRYWPIEELVEAPDAHDSLHSMCIVKAVQRLKNEGCRDNTLVFLPTERAILECTRALEAAFGEEYVVLPLFSRLAHRLQRRVFQTYSRPKIIVSTNVAETSLTIPGIRVVIDSGLARISKFNVKTRTKALPIEHISRASADQRAGRAGRTGPGIAVRLYSQEEYLGWDEHTLPEIKRSCLDSVLLTMLAMDIDEPWDFPFIDMPNQKAINEGLNTLKELGAIDGKGKLTAMGKTMAKLPLEPRISRMIIEGERLGATREVLIIASALSLKDVWDFSTRRDGAGKDPQLGHLVDEHSDFITLIRLWETYGKLGEKTGAKGERRAFCESFGLSYQRMEEWREIYSELKSILIDSGMTFKDRSRSASYEAIHKAIIVGFLSNIAHRRQDGVYQGTRGRELLIFPSSPLAKRRPEWIVCSEVVRTSRLFARTCATIDPKWIEDVAGDFLTSHIGEPHWEKKKGAVIAQERRYLWGLLVNPGRPVLYHRVDPELSRSIFIREGLSNGELGTYFPFNEHNKKVLKELKSLEERLRTSEIIETPEKIEAFFEKRLRRLEESYFHGNPITNVRDLKKVLYRARSDHVLRISKEDLLKKRPGEEELKRYPGEITVCGHKIKLIYRYSPGSEDDGVTAVIPAHILPYLSQGPFEWLVPGLLPEKLKLLLKGLPKKVRTALQPLDKTVEAILREGVPEREVLIRLWLATQLNHLFGIKANVFDFTREEGLPLALRFYFRVVGRNGKTIAKGRDIEALKAHCQRMSLGMRGQDDRVDAIKKKMEAPIHSIHDLKGIMQRVAINNNNINMLWLGIKIRGNNIVRTIFFDRNEAERCSREAVMELFLHTLKKELNDVKKRVIELSALSNDCILAFGGREGLTEKIMRLVLKEHFLDKTRPLNYEDIVERHDFLKKNIYKISSQGFPSILGTLRQWDMAKQEIASLFLKRPRGHNERHYSLFMDRLSEIFPVDFHREISMAQLQDIERQLQALSIRARRFYQNPRKDARKAEKIEPYRNFLEKIRKSNLANGIIPQLAGLISEFERHINEYEIQVFAPEIKTRVKVSPQKLDKLKEQIAMLIPEKGS